LDLRRGGSGSGCSGFGEDRFGDVCSSRAVRGDSDSGSFSAPVTNPVRRQKLRIRQFEAWPPIMTWDPGRKVQPRSITVVVPPLE
jgi:hypothetical protein